MGQVLEKARIAAVLSLATALLSGCLENEETSSSPSAFTNVAGSGTIAISPARNTRPSISGRPSTVAIVDSVWSFTPNASDSDGDSLTFSISNQPNWAQFSAATGRLSGRPQSGSEGSYRNISIAVSDGKESATLSSFAITVQKGDGNSAPVISGVPSPSATVGEAYTFTPGASDADNDSLLFAIANRPTWANFDVQTGQLSGTPQAGDAAVYDNIVISVSDGQLMDSINPFAINVTQIGASSVTLTLVAPTENEDNSPLTDLSAFKIYYGKSEGSYPNQILVDNPGVTEYVVDNLSPDTYYFVSTAVDSTGNESDYSNVVAMAIN